MTPKLTPQALASDVLALRAAVRALARIQARRSPAAMSELLQALAEETGRLGEAAPVYDEAAREQAEAAGATVAGWIADIAAEGQQAA